MGERHWRASGGASWVNEAEASEFGEFVRGRGHLLLRLAYVLTGDQTAAEELLRSALARAVLRWSRVGGDAEPYVRTVLVRRYTARWRQWRWRPATPTSTHPASTHKASSHQASSHQATSHQATSHQASSHQASSHQANASQASAGTTPVLAALAFLPPRQRAVIVLRYFELLDEPQTARLLGYSPATVASLGARALDTLRTRLPAGERLGDCRPASGRDGDGAPEVQP
jgi:RNA polymerase sigma factor (sigma-70 family)